MSVKQKITTGKAPVMMPGMYLKSPNSHSMHAPSILGEAVS
jgi:hypothetical protein